MWIGDARYSARRMPAHGLAALLLLGSSVGSVWATGLGLDASRFDANLKTSQDEFARFIVTYHDPRSASVSGRIRSGIARVGEMTGVPVAKVRWLSSGDLLVKSSHTVDREQARRILHEFALDDEVVNAQPDYIYELATLDPELANQWHLWPVGPNDDFAGVSNWTIQAGANVRDGWSLSRGSGVVIGVLDSGYTDHPDLLPNLVPPITLTGQPGFDFATGAVDDNDSVSGWDCDAHDPGSYYQGEPSIWHGTHVMGAAAAVADNGVAGAGVAPLARLMPVRIAGVHNQAYESDIVDAILWSSGANMTAPPPDFPADPPRPSTWKCGSQTYPAPAPRGAGYAPARVINLSFASDHGCGATSAMQTAITRAYNVGTAIVVAAGNWEADVSDPNAGVTPAGCSNVITVAATDYGGRPARTPDYPNHPPVIYTNYGSNVALAAPGGGWGTQLGKPDTYINAPILSTSNTGLTVPGNSSFDGLDGTSFAAPLVAGLAAAMVSLKPFLGPSDVRSKLVANVHTFGTGGLPASPAHYIGPGIMDGLATLTAVNAMANPALPSMTTSPTMPITLPPGQTTGSYYWSWTVPGYSVVDVYISGNGGPFIFDGVWPANFHPTTPNGVVVGYDMVWKLTPHGMPNVTLKSLTVSAHN